MRLEYKRLRDQGLAFPSPVLRGVALADTIWGEGAFIFPLLFLEEH